MLEKNNTKIKDAHKNIGAHRHISAEGWDFWQRAGEWGDGYFGWERTIDGADNLLLEGIGHTGLIEEPKHFHYWTERACNKTPTFDFLKEFGMVMALPEPVRMFVHGSPGD